MEDKAKVKFSLLALLFSSSLVTIYYYHKELIQCILEHYHKTLQIAYYGKSFFMFSFGLASIIGGFLSERVERKRLIQIWIASGILVLVLFSLLQGPQTIFLFSPIIGLSLGWGLPSLFALFAETTKIDKRGNVASRLQLIVYVIVLVILFVVRGSGLSFQTSILISIAIWASAFLGVRDETISAWPTKSIAYREIIRSRKTLIYLVPWAIFNTCNSLLLFIDRELPLTPEYKSVYLIGAAVFFLMTVIFGLISGRIADRSGRKPSLILGFTSLGIAYAFIGISLSPFNIMMLYVFQGIAWGIIIVSFQWLILGDLAGSQPSSKYYALGLAIPPFIETGILLFASRFSIPLSPTRIASIVSVIMFISVIPLLYAPETLPDNLIQDRRFKEYLKKVLQLVEESNE